RVVHPKDQFVAEPVTENVHSAGKYEGQNHSLTAAEGSSEENEQHRQPNHENDCFRCVHFESPKLRASSSTGCKTSSFIPNFFAPYRNWNMHPGLPVTRTSMLAF